MRFDPTPLRPRYRPSGAVRWASFLPWTALALAVSIGMGCALHAVYYNHFYLVFLAPILASLPVWGLAFSAVHHGHCRNRLVTVLLALVLPLVLYTSQFYAGFLHSAGLRDASRLDRLRAYIEARMNADAFRKAGPVGVRQPSDPARDLLPSPGMNWSTSIFEFGCLVVFFMPLILRRSRTPYCETHRCWMLEQSATFERPAGRTLSEALRTGALPPWAAHPPRRAPATEPHTVVSIHYCPHPHVAAESPLVYLTVKEADSAKKQYNLRKSVSPGRRLLDQAALSSTEVASLAVVFPVLSAPPSASVAPSSGRRASPPPGRATIDIRPLPAQLAGKVLTPKMITIGNLLTLTNLPLFFGGIAMVAAGYLVAAPAGAPDSFQLSRLLLIASGLLSAGIGGYLGLYHPSYLGNLYLRHVVRSEFQSRPDPIVDPGDPNAVFVEVVPRENWHSTKFETATDIGFLFVDTQRRQLLFEGDKERYSIPAGAITSCEMEQLNPMGGSLTLFMIVIHVLRDDGTLWELPLCRRFHPFRDVHTDRRRQLASQLKGHIQDLIPAADLDTLDVLPADEVLLEED